MTTGDETVSGTGGWFYEDLQPRIVDAVVDYAHEPAGPVKVSVVRRDGIESGYLWAEDASDAAGFVPTVAGGTDAVNAGVSFSLRLRNAKSRGLTPVEAIQEIIDDGPSALGQAEPIKAEPMSFADLQAMAPRLARHPRYMDAEPSAADRGQPRRRGGD